MQNQMIETAIEKAYDKMERLLQMSRDGRQADAELLRLVGFRPYDKDAPHSLAQHLILMLQRSKTPKKASDICKMLPAHNPQTIRATLSHLARLGTKVQRAGHGLYRAAEALS